MWRSVKRWARAVAVSAGIAVVLTVSVRVMNRPPDEAPPTFNGGASIGFPLEPGGNALRDYYSYYMPFIDPVPLGRPVAMIGDPGLGAWLRVDPGPALGAYIVQVRNIGAEPVDGSFSTGGAWLESDDGERFYPPKVRLLSSGTVSPAAIGSGAEVLLELSFTVPAHVRPARLLLSLQLGQFGPYAQWDLPAPAGR